MTSKQAVKTYSKSNTKETVASRAFDEAFTQKQNAAAAPIKAAPTTKWGKTSFCRVRDDDPFETTYKKVKIENETFDPFTFDYEDEGVPTKIEPVITPTTTTATSSNHGNNSAVNQAGMHFGGLGRPAIPNMKVQKGGPTITVVETITEVPVQEEPKETESQPLFRRPIKTYSRLSKREQNSDGKKQMTMDQFASPPNKSGTEEEMEEENEGVESESTSQPGGSQEQDIFVQQNFPRQTAEDIFGDDEEDDQPPVLVKETGRTYGKRGNRGGRGRIARTQKTTSRTHLLQSTDDETKTTVLNFRSVFMDPAVYSKFNYTPTGEDPIGRLHNSKVLQKSEVKHGKGSTLIVVCSPKPVPEGKPKLAQVVAQSKDVTRATELIQSTEEDVKFSESEFDEIEAASKQRGEKRENPKVADSPNKKHRVSFAMDLEEDDDMKEPPLSSKGPVDADTTRITRASGNGQPRKNKIFRSRNREIKEEPKTDESQSQESVIQISSESEVADSQESDKAQTGMEDEGLDSGYSDEPKNARSSRSKTKLSDNAFGFDETGATESDSQNSEQTDDISELASTNILSKGKSKKDATENDSQESAEVELMESSQESLPDSQSSTEASSSQEIVKKKSQNIPPKDRKIFKSRNKNLDVQRKIFQSPKKSPSKAVYNVRSWQADFDEEERSGSSSDESQPPKLIPVTKQVPQFEENDSKQEPPRLVRAMHWPKKDDAYTSVHVTKQHKELYTVVKNVKEAHECQEYGETQEYIDDVEYLLAGLQEKQPMSTRCLSCIGIAQKCIIPAFRMHLRAHGIITKIFGSVQDACSDPSLALCTSLVMFMLSRDRLNMDLDDQSLNLMLSLLGVDNQEQLSATMTATGKRALNRNKDRVKEVYEQLQKELQKEGKPKMPELEFVSTGNLAMESLLSLTSRSAGEWFKEELRIHGALDHIVDTVCSCIEVVSGDTTLLTDSTIENIKKIDRCLRVLENVTFVNQENQQYLISYKQSGLIKSVCSALYTCEQCLPIYPLVDNEKVDKESTGHVIYSCILAILRMLLNITHENEFACTKVGEQNVFIDTTLVCILQTPQYVPLDFRFDILVLSIGLLINLVEHCEVNRRRLIEAYTNPSYELSSTNTVVIPAIQALVQMFCHRFEIANKMEEQDFKDPTTPSHSPDKSGEWRESDSGMEWVINSAKKDGSTSEEGKQNNKNSNEPLNNGNSNNLDDEETFTKALHRAGKHMENSIVASYVALLLGCLIQDNSVFVEKVKSHLPSGNFDDMIAVLKKFLGFMNFTSVIGSTGGKSIARVIEVLEVC